MALQSVRALLFRGEDLTAPTGQARELILPTQAALAQRPTVATFGFSVSSTQLTALFAGLPTGTHAAAGLNRVLVNRSGRFFLTVAGQLSSANAGGTAVGLSFPVPPGAWVFLPSTFGVTGTLTVTAGTTWPAPAAPSPALPVPAPGSSVVSLDVVLE